ncbi:MAG: transcriptional regulator [Pedosphaera sp.]|nr:transcriptional regulator [Pedosphaera sp.]
MNKIEVLQRFQAKIASGQPIIGGFIKQPTRPETLAAADLLALYHTAKLQHHGLIAGLLPLGNANKMIMEFAESVAPMAETKPVLAGVSAADPFRLMQFFLKEVQKAGFVGIQNFPSVGIIDGPFRSHLESSSSGYNKEIELIRLAHGLGLLTAPLVFNPDEATRMIRAGADILVINPPLKTSDSGEGEDARSCDELIPHLTKIINTARTLRADLIILYNNYSAAGLATGHSLFEACPGLNGYWLA